jgi:hypothetical protein
MPINFFDGACKTESNKGRFGLCDDTPPPENLHILTKMTNQSGLEK